jgi:PAS domain S-box-containing protein
MVGTSDNPEPRALLDRGGPAHVAAVLGLAAVYVAAAKLGLSLEVAQGNATPVWPPTGIALAALLILGPRMWPGVLLGAFIANATTPIPLWTAGLIAVGNASEAVIGALLLRRFGFRNSLDRVKDVLALTILAGLVATTVSATVGVTALVLASEIVPSTYALHWEVWWIGDVMGTLLVTPALLAWVTARPRMDRARALEALAILVGLIVVSITFLRVEPPAATYALFPLVIWASLRFRQIGASTSVLIGAGFAIAAILSGSKPFGGIDATQAVALMQALLAGVAISNLVVAATLSERDKAEVGLRKEAALVADREAQLAEAQDVARLGSWEWDVVSKEVTWSDEMYVIYGYGTERFPITFEKALERVVVKDRPKILQNVSRGMEEGAGHDLRDVEYRVRFPDGNERVMYGKGRLVFAPDGSPLQMLGTVQDITDRKQAQRDAERIRHIEDRQRQAIALNDDVVQGLAIAKLSMELDDSERAYDAVAETLESARTIVSELLSDAEVVGPGDLVKHVPTPVASEDGETAS